MGSAGGDRVHFSVPKPASPQTLDFRLAHPEINTLILRSSTLINIAMATGAGLSLVGSPKTLAAPASTQTGPAVATAGTQIYVAWVDGDQRIWLTMAGGSANPQSPPVALPDPIRTTFTPALAIFQPTKTSGVLLYIAWHDTYDSNIYYATISADPTKTLLAGMTTFTLGSVIGAGSIGPSMTTFPNGLGLVFAGAPSDGSASSILYSFFDGARWQPVQTVIKANAGQSGMGTDQQPSICAFGPTNVAVLWKGPTPVIDKVYWGVYLALNSNESLLPLEPNPTPITGSGTNGSPVLAVLQVQTQYFLYAAWKGSPSDHQIYYTGSQTSSGTTNLGFISSTLPLPPGGSQQITLPSSVGTSRCTPWLQCGHFSSRRVS
jgi:hypothetical protein